MIDKVYRKKNIKTYYTKFLSFRSMDYEYGEII